MSADVRRMVECVLVERWSFAVECSRDCYALEQFCKGIAFALELTSPDLEMISDLHFLAGLLNQIGHVLACETLGLDPTDWDDLFCDSVVADRSLVVVV